MIDIQNATYAYTGGHPAVNGVSLRIAARETVGVVGSNGAGKSTLLKMMCGVLTPAAGAFTLDGVTVDGSKDNARLARLRRKVGYIFQNPDDQLFMSSVYEDIAFGLRNYGDSDAQVEEKARRMLRRLGIEHLAERAPFTLSGGEKRVAAMACVLVMEPSVMLFDEPTAFLDPKARRNFINLVRELPTTNVIVSHDMELILELCGRVIVMSAGKVTGDGPTEALLFDKAIMEAADLEAPRLSAVCENCGKPVSLKNTPRVFG